FVIKPIAGDVSGIIVWRRRGGAVFKRRRRFGSVAQRALILIGPESRRPAPSLRTIRPMARHPATSRRRVAERAADPHKIVAVGIPCPVAGNPLHVGVVRALLRR